MTDRFAAAVERHNDPDITAMHEALKTAEEQRDYATRLAATLKACLEKAGCEAGAKDAEIEHLTESCATYKRCYEEVDGLVAAQKAEIERLKRELHGYGWTQS